jgi:hypothetical protein
MICSPLLVPWNLSCMHWTPIGPLLSRNCATYVASHESGVWLGADDVRCPYSDRPSYWIAQLFNDYSPGSYWKVVPPFNPTYPGPGSIYISGSEHTSHDVYTPSCCHNFHSYASALSLIPFIANYGQVASSLGRFQKETYSTSEKSSSTEQAPKSQPDRSQIIHITTMRISRMMLRSMTTKSLKYKSWKFECKIKLRLIFKQII